MNSGTSSDVSLCQDIASHSNIAFVAAKFSSLLRRPPTQLNVRSTSSAFKKRRRLCLWITVNSLVLSRTGFLVLLRTKSSCYQGPKSVLTYCAVTQIGALNLSNTKESNVLGGQDCWFSPFCEQQLCPIIPNWLAKDRTRRRWQRIGRNAVSGRLPASRVLRTSSLRPAVQFANCRQFTADPAITGQSQRRRFAYNAVVLGSVSVRQLSETGSCQFLSAGGEVSRTGVKFRELASGYPGSVHALGINSCKNTSVSSADRSGALRNTSPNFRACLVRKPGAASAQYINPEPSPIGQHAERNRLRDNADLRNLEHRQFSLFCELCRFSPHCRMGP
jgi:hypothetical protein